MRKKAIKVKHVKRREKKIEKKVSFLVKTESIASRRSGTPCPRVNKAAYAILNFSSPNYLERVAPTQAETEAQGQKPTQRAGGLPGQRGDASVSGAQLCESRSASLQILFRGLWHEAGCQVSSLHLHTSTWRRAL